MDARDGGRAGKRTFTILYSALPSERKRGDDFRRQLNIGDAPFVPAAPVRHTIEAAGHSSVVVAQLYAAGFWVDVPGTRWTHSNGSIQDFIPNDWGVRYNGGEWQSAPVVQHHHIAPSRILEIIWEEDV